MTQEEEVTSWAEQFGWGLVPLPSPSYPRLFLGSGGGKIQGAELNPTYSSEANPGEISQHPDDDPQTQEEEEIIVLNL